MLVSHMKASGLPELISMSGCTGSSCVPIELSCACNLCDLRWSLIEKNFCLRAVSV